MSPKRQRLVLLTVALVGLGGATALGLSAIGDNATYFYAPTDLAKTPPAPGETFRLGGLVEPGSIARAPDGVTVAFLVTDNATTTPVRYTGLTPDLFKEGSGVIATGRLAPDGTFEASELLAKHDEKYMPPEVAESLERGAAMHKSATVKAN